MSTQNDPLVLTGTQSNATQLEVTAHAPQDHPIQTWRIGGGAVAQISQDGRLEVGDQAVASSASAALIEANQNISASSQVIQGVQTRGIAANAMTNPLVWSTHDLDFNGSGGVGGDQIALRAKITHNNTGSGTTADLRGGQFEAANSTGSSGQKVKQVTGVHAIATNGPGAPTAYVNKAIGVKSAIANASGATIDEAAAFEVAPPTNTGTIGQLYGLRIPDLTLGGVNYAIYTGAGNIRFGGQVTIEGSPNLYLNSPASQTRSIWFQTNTSRRWAMLVSNQTEAGSNAGSNFLIDRYDDNGNYLGYAVYISRSSGDIAYARDMSVARDGGIGRNLWVAGNISKGSGTFLIDHPLDPTNRNLIHSFIEAPKADLFYRGKVTLSKGRASVSIDAAAQMTPGTFEALTRHAEAQVWVQNDTGWEPVRGKVVLGTLEIECKDPASTDTISWLVVAERADPYIRHSDTTDENGQLKVEVDKPIPTEEDLKALEPRIQATITSPQVEVVTSLNGKRGYPLHPEAIGLTQPTREVRSPSQITQTDEPR